VLAIGLPRRPTMHRFSTLRVRFALWVSGLLLAMLVALGAFVYTTMARGLTASIDDSLRLSASQVIAAVDITNNRISFTDTVPQTGEAGDLRQRGVTIRVIDPQGHIVQAFGPYRDLPLNSSSLPAAGRQQSTFATLTVPATGVPVRFYVAPIIENSQLVGIVQVGESLEGVRETLDRLLTAQLLGGPGKFLPA
jgi:hypothetical protein